MTADTPGDRPDPFELAVPVAERVQIQSVLIVESHSKRGEDKQFEDGGLSLAHNYFVKQCGTDDENKILSVTIQFVVSTVRGGVPEENPTLMISAIFALVYTLDNLDGLTEDNYKAFAVINGIYNAWPYWREYVQNTSVRMGVPPIVPPVFRFTSATPHPTQTATTEHARL